MPTSRHPIPLVDPSRFLLATRESGYKTTAAALSELIDNSIQASAREIRVILRENPKPSGGSIIAVVDDGEGMEPGKLVTALQFGGSTRFGERRGAGRFGLGLPNASLSQARRVDLFAWTEFAKVLHVFLDIDSFSQDGKWGIDQPRYKRCPDWLDQFRGPKGAAVVWSNCDRLPALGRQFEASLREELARVFRVHIGRGIRITVCGERLDPIDPIEIIPRPDHHRVQLLPPLRFNFVSPITGKPSPIVVRFAILPVRHWGSMSTDRKRDFRIVNRAGVSVLRADREIAYGWHFLNGKRRENYDDWWRCEISFQPDLDEVFGVTNSKQGIRPRCELVDCLAPTMIAQARILNREVRRQFAKLAANISPAEKKAEMRHARLRLSDLAASRKQSLTHFRKVIRGVRYKLLFEDSSRRAFVTAEQKKGTVRVTVNRHHPFFADFYAPLTSTDRSMKERLDCVILSLGRALIVKRQTIRQQAVLDFLESWSDAVALVLGR